MERTSSGKPMWLYRVLFGVTMEALVANTKHPESIGLRFTKQDPLKNAELYTAVEQSQEAFDTGKVTNLPASETVKIPADLPDSILLARRLHSPSYKTRL